MQQTVKEFVSDPKDAIGRMVKKTNYNIETGHDSVCCY
jgi:hypothetical protein